MPCVATAGRETRVMTEEEDRHLVEAARSAATASYSPYSRFRVGAAVLAGGKVYTGCNIENASFGLTICAERAAIFAAISAGNTDIQALALSCIDATDSSDEQLKVPCGACRQVVEEFATEE